MTAQDQLYDARRRCYYEKPVLRGWLHLALFQASLVIGTLVLTSVHGAARIVTAAVYAATVSGLFGTSALYHRGRWGERASCLLQRVDHTMIFLLIAGTATPAFILGLPGLPGIVGASVLWAATLTAAVIHLCWMDAPEKLVGGTFITLGVSAGVALPAVWIHSGVPAGTLMLVGGALYIVGALAYHARWPDPRPSVFGFHEVFHTFVGLAAACQYVAIAIFVV